MTFSAFSEAVSKNLHDCRQRFLVLSVIKLHFK